MRSTPPIAGVWTPPSISRGIERLDVLVNNVGQNDLVLGSEEHTAESWRRILDVNLVGPAADR